MFCLRFLSTRILIAPCFELLIMVQQPWWIVSILSCYEDVNYPSSTGISIRFPRGCRAIFSTSFPLGCAGQLPFSDGPWSTYICSCVHIYVCNIHLYICQRHRVRRVAAVMRVGGFVRLSGFEGRGRVARDISGYITSFLLALLRSWYKCGYPVEKNISFVNISARGFKSL